MAIIGALDHTKHFSEFSDPLDTGSGAVAAATRKALALANLGITASGAELNVLDGVTAGTVAASKAIVVDANKDITGMGSITFQATDGIRSAVAANLRGEIVPVAVQQALSGAGAVNLTTYYTAVTNTGSDALTLADSTVLGQVKKVKMIVDPGTDSTLTFNTNATIVFADVGDYAILVWDGADWIPIELGNDADGATAPAYTPAS